ncbi:MAG: hypothetical protein A2096_02340 [Spirochaetes bacterium GWF1_41_5]|nr:MAG: hypothetical protein A2096_02340 [Spirochaetes bacterium GWF1_41_5]
MCSQTKNISIALSEGSGLLACRRVRIFIVSGVQVEHDDSLENLFIKRQRQLIILFSVHKADAKRAEAPRKQHYILA